MNRSALHACAGFLLACSAIAGLRFRVESDYKAAEAASVTPNFFLTEDLKQVGVFVPDAYQEVDGANRFIDTLYRQEDANEISFRLGPFDPGYPLHLDLAIQRSRSLRSQDGERINPTREVNHSATTDPPGLPATPQGRVNQHIRGKSQ